MTDALSVPFIALAIAIVVIVLLLVVLLIWVASVSRRLKRVTGALIDERKKVSQIARYLSGQSGKLNLQGLSDFGDESEGSSYFEDTGAPRVGADGTYSVQDHDKHGLGRKKPVIPFGADKSVQQRAAQVAAAQIDESQSRSIELNEPDRAHPSRRLPIMGQGLPAQQPMPVQGTQPQVMQPMPQQAVRQNPMPPSSGEGMRIQPLAGSGVGVGNPGQTQPIPMGQPLPQAQAQGTQSNPRIQQGQQVSPQPRTTVDKLVNDLDSTTMEKTAVSAAWIAEEERRLQAKKEREAAQEQAKEAREQEKRRRNAELIMQEHQRQVKEAHEDGSASTLRLD